MSYRGTPILLDTNILLSTHWERLGKRMEQNDLWIAATAKVPESTLLTTDEDFIKLSETLDVEWVDPAHLKKISK